MGKKLPVKLGGKDGGIFMEHGFAELKQHLLKIYKHNPFVCLLEMTIEDLAEGMVEFSMPVREDKHTNLFSMAHGGAIASLADTAMGVSCATLNKRMVTLDMNINFIKSAKPGETVRATGRVIHNGSKTMVAECEIRGEEGLLAKARGTFFVTGKFLE
ncbi:MAG: PaaI family thioesterase [Negativicutes bacterium]|nr:PaaI family thioesterase [Negativicutes bacterium]